METLGARTEWRGDADLILTPPEAWQQPQSVLDCGNSGTTIRLLAGLVAGHPIVATLTGDESLSRRPMKRIAVPLQLMGADVEGDTAPLTIRGRTKLKGIEYTSPVASGQIKSCVLLAGLTADGATILHEPSKSRDHTERMLSALGINIVSKVTDEGVNTVWIKPGKRIPSFEITVPGDLSSAAFWMVAAVIVKNGRVDLAEVGVNSTRAGIFDVFDQAGIYYEIIESPAQLDEPTAAVCIQPNEDSDRRPFSISGSLVPRLLDEIPVLAVLATQLNGTSVIRDASELRIKETDRLVEVAEGLSKMGANVELLDDGMTITGPTALKGAHIDARGDHRIGMSFAIAGLIAEGETVIEGAETRLPRAFLTLRVN